MSKAYVDPARRGIVRFEGTDSMDGILVGTRASELVKRWNAYEPMAEALKYAISEIEAFYKAAEDGRIKTVITIGQFGRLDRARAALNSETQKEGKE